MKPRLLVVPHLYADNLFVREIELARRLTQLFDVYCLKWTDALHVDDGSTHRRRWKQLATAIRAVFVRRHFSEGADGITYVELPVLQPILLRRAVGSEWALSLSQAFNGSVIEELVGAYGISYALLASESFGLLRRVRARVFFDIVDWFPEENSSPRHLDSVRSRLKSIANKVQGIFAVSEPLCEKLKADYGINAVLLPNGADLKVLRSVGPDEVAAVRSQWGLAGKFVIGYIGNHGSFTGVDFVLKVFQAVRQRITNAVLLIVGPADYWGSILAGMRSQGVVCTGPVAPSEVAAYFNAIDLGILAQEKSLGTEFAFQIKIVEYSACRKFVVATPLQTWQRLQWPNIFLAEREVEPWVAAICQAREASWSPAWDALIDPYDWSTLALRMAKVLLG